MTYGTRAASMHQPDSLDGLVAGRVQTFRGWRLVPRSLLGDGPRWIFP